MLLAAAQAALAAGAAAGLPRTRAEAARRMFRAQGRAWWRSHAGAAAPAGALRGRPAVPRAAAPGRAGRARAWTASAPPTRSRRACWPGGSPRRWAGQRRRTAHFAAAARSQASPGRGAGAGPRAGSPRRCEPTRRAISGGCSSACRRGLAVLDEHLRHARRLRTAGPGHRAGRRTRGTGPAGRAQVGPVPAAARVEREMAGVGPGGPARPARWTTPDLQADLTALRDVTSRLDRAAAGGDPDRAPAARAAAAGAARSGPGAAIPGRRPGRRAQVRRRVVSRPARRRPRWSRSSRSTATCTCWSAAGPGHGTCAAAARTTRPARWSSPGSRLRRLAHGAGRRPGRTALAVLEASGARLESVLLGPAAGMLGSGPVIVVPPGRLHAVPWALLPSLRDRAVSVAPSARAWLQARGACTAGTGGAGAGPGARPRRRRRRDAGAGRGVPGRDRAGSGGPPPRAGCSAPSTARRSPTSRRTARSGPTARCSRRCGWTTARSPCTTWSGCAARRTG